eukprot:6187608-Pleurochrysis_carterae.AAC.1
MLRLSGGACGGVQAPVKWSRALPHAICSALHGAAQALCLHRRPRRAEAQAERQARRPVARLATALWKRLGLFVCVLSFCGWCYRVRACVHASVHGFVRACVRACVWFIELVICICACRGRESYERRACARMMLQAGATNSVAVLEEVMDGMPSIVLIL